jgi:hypothetical protein
MQAITTIGLDIAKSVFQVHGIDGEGKVLFRRQLKRRYLLAFFQKLPSCLVGIDACASSHHWSRELQALGHTVRLMPPAYVKPYVKRQKNDAADAEAICEDVPRAPSVEEIGRLLEDTSSSDDPVKVIKPPEISYDDDPKPAVFQGEPPRPVEVVEVPKPLPLPGQLKAIPGGPVLGPEPKNPTDRVAKANEAARVQPTRNGYINAVQVYPYTIGALYQVYTAPGQVTDIALQ